MTRVELFCPEHRQLVSQQKKSGIQQNAEQPGALIGNIKARDKNYRRQGTKDKGNDRSYAWELRRQTNSGDDAAEKGYYQPDKRGLVPNLHFACESKMATFIYPVNNWIIS